MRLTEASCYCAEYELILLISSPHICVLTNVAQIYVVSLTEHDAADVVNTLGDGLSASRHGDTPLSAARQSVASNLRSKMSIFSFKSFCLINYCDKEFDC